MRYINVEVMPSGRARIDDVGMSLKEFVVMLPEYRGLGRKFKVFPY